MKVEILQENLVKSVLLVQRFAGKKSSLPILSNILITAETNQLTFQASDMETLISLTEKSQVDESGIIAIPAQTLGEYLKTLPPGKLTLTEVNQGVLLSSASRTAEIAGVESEDFPTPPVQDYLPSITLPTTALKQIVSQVSYAASKEEARPVLASLLLKFSPDSMEVVATDGYRLSQLFFPHFSSATEAYQILVPAKVVAELDRLTNETQVENVTVEVSEDTQSIRFSLDNIILVSRLIDGKYPEYQKILPKSSSLNITVDRSELLDLLKSASIFARQNAHIVRLSIGAGTLTVSANAARLGKQSAKMSLLSDTQREIEVAFNVDYLLDVLSHFGSSEVSIGINEPLMPVTFKGEKPDLVHVIMPVRTQS